MYACLCRAVPEQRVRDAVAAGASTMNEIRATCGAGTGCGGCLPSLRRLLRESLGRESLGPGSLESGPSGPGHLRLGLVCTAASVLDGCQVVLEPACSGNCAEVPEPGAGPTCVAGLRDAAGGRGDDAGPDGACHPATCDKEPPAGRQWKSA